MKTNKKVLKAEDRFRRLQMEIILIFATIIIIITTFLVTVILERSNTLIREQVSGLTAANNRQIQLNINNYLDKVETTAALLFADEEYYKYDATDLSQTEYARLKTEENILGRIVDLGVMENFADFAIVYTDDHTIGWVSHTTDDMFPDGGMYQAFDECIVNEMTNDGWKFGLNDNMERTYYVKRLNPSAVLFVSFYNKELENVFKYPEELRGLVVRLIDENGRILFSSQKEENGAELAPDIRSRIDDQRNMTSIDDDYLITSNLCENDWKVVCLVPTKQLLRENIQLKNFTILFSSVLSTVFIIIALLLIRRISRPVDGMMSRLEQRAVLDRLSGLLNKISFQEETSHRMDGHLPGRYFVFIMLDADNFKQVNDRLGHARGDDVIVRICKILKWHLGEISLLGRIGGDEFAVFMDFSGFGYDDVLKNTTEKLNDIFNSLEEEFATEQELCDFSLSAGICVAKDDASTDFQTIYQRADAALYASKRSGKKRYTLYQEGMEHHE